MFNKKEDPLGLDKGGDTSNQTVVGGGVSLTGDLESKGDITVAGNVSGKISTDKTVSILPGAKVEADISAETVKIGGKVQGNVSAKSRVTIDPGGELKGNLVTQKVQISDGAVFNGQCQMGNNSPNRTAA